jgi:cytochrome b6-f complex iron-sulfur subunit
MMARSETHPTRSPAEAPEPARRRFLARLWWGLGGVAALELAWIGGSFLRPRARRGETADVPGVIVAGPVDSFAPGSVTPFPAGRFYLARLENGGFLALDRRCTHLGCTVPWLAGEGRFACPCHASTFTITGEVSGPPAPRPLDTYPVRIENGVVKVDVTRSIRRTAHHPDQVVHAG